MRGAKKENIIGVVFKPSVIAILTVTLNVLPVYSATNKCPLPTPDSAAIGSQSSITLEIWDCIRASSSSSPACGGSPMKSIRLTKGVKTDISVDKNSYSVMAVFYGSKVCVSYRKRDRRLGTIIRDDSTCKTACFTSGTFVTYFTDLHCFGSCHGSYESLDFVAKAALTLSPNWIATVTISTLGFLSIWLRT